MNKPTKMQMFTALVQRSITYNIVEFGLIVTFISMELIMGSIWPPLLWTAAGLTGLWVLMSSTRMAEAEAKDMILVRQIYMTDFVSGALSMGVLIFLTMDYGLQFGIIFLVAMIQHIRYTVLSLDWLIKEKNDKRKRESGRDNLS